MTNAVEGRDVNVPNIGAKNFLGPLYSLAVPAAGMQYARELTARYLLKAAKSRGEDKIDMVFPIPSLQRANGSFNLPAAIQPSIAAPAVFETSPDDMLPVPIEINLTSSELTRAVKTQIKAHVLATLAVNARQGTDEATVKEDIENLARAALMIEMREREEKSEEKEKAEDQGEQGTVAAFEIEEEQNKVANKVDEKEKQESKNVKMK